MERLSGWKEKSTALIISIQHDHECIRSQEICVRVIITLLSHSVMSDSDMSMRFSRQEYWSGLPFPSPGYLSNPGIEPRSPAFQVDSSPSEPAGKLIITIIHYN